MGGVIYFVLVFFKMISESCQGDIYVVTKQVVTQYLCDLKSLPTFIIAFCIFCFFKNLQFTSNKIINDLAKSAFAVYVIHQHPAFYMYLWKNICCCDLWMSTKYALIIVCIITLFIYLSCSIVDFFMRRYFEACVCKSRVCVYVEKKLDSFYSQI